jgi:hypothetical protein
MLKSDPRNAWLELYSASGQLKRKLIVQGWSPLVQLDYSSGGKAFYTSFAAAGMTTLLRIDRTGHAEPLWSNPGPGRSMFAIESPDGRHVALWVDGSTANAWLFDLH